MTDLFNPGLDYLILDEEHMNDLQSDRKKGCECDTSVNAFWVKKESVEE